MFITSLRSLCGPIRATTRQHVFNQYVAAHSTQHSRTDRHPARPLAPPKTSGTSARIPQRHVIATHRAAYRATIECENVMTAATYCSAISVANTRMRQTATSSRFVMYRYTSDENCEHITTHCQHVSSSRRCPEKNALRLLRTDKSEQRWKLTFDARAHIQKAMLCIYTYMYAGYVYIAVENRFSVAGGNVCASVRCALARTRMG